MLAAPPPLFTLKRTLVLALLLTGSLTLRGQEGIRDGVRGEQSSRRPVLDSGRTRAVIVGISAYKNLPENKQLDYADEDARLFYNWLQVSRPLAKAELFIDKDATASRILLAVDEMLSQSVPGDELIIYFAGHGDVAKDKTKNQDDAYLLCTNVATDADYSASDAISLSGLQKLIADAARSGIKLSLITDACRSGKVATSEEAAYSTAYILSQKWDKVMKLASCQENELSYEHVKWGNGHGVFTYYLVRGLSREADTSPKDDKISLMELELYLKKEVSAATEYIQNPVKLGGDARAVFGVSLANELIDQTVYLPKFQVMLASRDGDTVSRFGNPQLDALYTAFRSHARSGRLKDSAYAVFQLFEKADIGKAHTKLLRNELVLELAASTQRLLDKYLQGGNDMPPASAFLKAAEELDLAIKLYNRNNSITQHWRSEQLFLQAFSYIRAERREKYPEATALLKKALKGNKKAAYVYQAFGRMYHELGDYKQSEKYLLQAIELAPRWTYPRSDLGNTYKDMQRWKQAEQVFHDALAIDPSLAKLYNNLSNIYLDQGKLAQSEKLYHKAASLAPNTAVYFSNLGVVHVNQGRTESAVDMFKKALSLDSNYYYTYIQLGRHYLEDSKDYDKAKLALKYIRKAIEMEPYYYEGYNKMGDYYFEYNSTRADLEKGIAMYRKAVELNHRDVESYYEMAFYLLNSLKDTVKAEAAIREMLKKNPREGYALYYKGAFEEDKENKSEAEKWYRKALDLDPYVLSAYTQLSDLLEKEGKWNEAEAVLLGSLKYFTDNPEQLYSVANFYLRKGQKQDAINYYHQCLAVDSSYSYAWSSLAYILLKTSAPAKEITTAFGKARLLNPHLHKPESFASMLKMKADSLMAAKADPSLVLSFLTEALELDPAKSDLYQVEIARVHYFANDLIAAEAALSQISARPSHFIKQGQLSLQWKIELQKGNLQKAEELITQEFTESAFPSYLGKALLAWLSKNETAAKELIKKEREENSINLKQDNLEKKYNQFLIGEIQKIME